jgi:hypothetical protein
MARERKKTSWEDVPLSVGVIGLLALLLAYLWRREWALPVLISASALQGLAFLWAFALHDVWWAVLPGIGLLTLASICLVYCLLLGSIGWLGVLILGLGAYVIAVIPNVKIWINLFYVLGVMLVWAAIYVSPIVLVWKIVLTVAFVLLFVLTLWLDREDLGRAWA